MHIKIYFNDKPLFLTDTITPEIESYRHHDDAVFIDEFSHQGVNTMIHEMRQDKVHAGVYLHSDVKELEKAFKKKFQIIQAAGGLVVNEEGGLLFIFRRGKWDLPKGKLDKGEKLEVCAVRETEEETGIGKVKLEKHLITSYHTYNESGHQILKETWWYLMSAPGNQKLTPQTEEQITAIEWGDPQKLDKFLANTYDLIVDVLQTAGYAK